MWLSCNRLCCEYNNVEDVVIAARAPGYCSSVQIITGAKAGLIKVEEYGKGHKVQE